MITLSIFLSLINSLAAGLIITCNITNYGHPSFDLRRTILQNAVSMLVITFGIHTWLSGIRDTNSRWVLPGGIILFALGVIIFMWAYHLSVINGHAEYFMAGYGISLTIQGLASLLGYANQRENAMS